MDTTRIWWVQAETVVGFLNAYEKSGDEVFKKAALEEWEYIKTYLIDPRSESEWYWQLNDENKPNTDYPIVEPWKCPYHNGGMCLEVMRRKVDA
ncbi:MAG: AGE family epimerase/isomerase [Cellulosilyticum sp.]|nr:AGE family epimerase/isomerase [Cellulosilyticum sp.]